MTDDRAFGIDLGTTFSAVARWSEELQRAELIPSMEGQPTTPSVVHRDESGEVTVGLYAAQYRAADPENTQEFFKRLMGQDVELALGDLSVNPVVLSRMVIEKLMRDVLEATGEPMVRSVVTVPAYFTNSERTATQRAVEEAGLELVGLLNEPTAAALAYEAEAEVGSNILVYDLGGGTFDVSVVRVGEHGPEVVATGGDHELGGKDWDDQLLDIVASRFEDETGFNPLDELDGYTPLRAEVEEAKRALTERSTASIAVTSGGNRARIEVTREEFDQATRPLLEQTWAVTARVLEDAGLAVSDVWGVLPVGGSTKMPSCRSFLEERMGQQLLAGSNPDQIVALGAAQYSAQRIADESPGGGLAVGSTNSGGLAKSLTDVTAHALGNVVVDAAGSAYVNDVIIPRNSPVPCERSVVRKVDASRDGGELVVFVLQGDAREPWLNQCLGRYRFDDIPPGDGSTQVEISYAYDRDGVVNVSAVVDGKELGRPSVDSSETDLSWTRNPPRAPVGATAVVLAIDLSGSMDGEPLVAAKEACSGFFDALSGSARVGLVGFGSVAEVYLNLESEADPAPVISNLRVTGSTNMADGIAKSMSVLAGSEAKVRAIVLLTDGAPDSVDETLRAATTARNDGIEIVPVGIGAANEGFLSQIATLDSGSLMSGLESLTGDFIGIAQELAEMGLSKPG